LAVPIIVTSCASPVQLDLTDEQITPVAATWVNQTGLFRDEPGVWRVRLTEACTQRVWDDDVAVRLAERYVTDDMDFAMEGVEDGRELRDRASQALWIMAVQVCGDSFPEGEIEEGPPGI
jgi:hypothetical protein